MWVLVVGGGTLLVKRGLDRVADEVVTRSVARLRPWLREKFFQVFLLKSTPSPRAELIARYLAEWLRRLPRIPADALGHLDPGVHEQGVRQVVATALGIVWGAYTEERSYDRTLQLGMWLRLAGLGGILLGVQAFAAGQPWATADIALGLTVVGAGHYLGALPYRPLLLLAVLGLGPVAIAMDTQFSVPGTGLVVAARVTLAIGSVLAAVASTAVILDIAGASFRPRRRRRRRALLRARLFMIWLGMRVGGVGMFLYGLSNVLQSFYGVIAPTLAMQATHLWIAGCLFLAALETRHPTTAYRRLLRAH
jgi:hypothetical protein